MDPLSLAAIVGLVYSGKKISDAKEEQQQVPTMLAPKKITRTELDLKSFRRSQDPVFDETIMTPDIGRGFAGNPDWRLRSKEAVPNMGDIVKDGKRFPFGQPVYDVSYREAVTNKMNNLNPADKVYVGRGLGLDPNTPAAGGFQQFFRIEPTNMNEERLSTLPGTWGGPANSFIKNGGTTMGEITHHAKQTKAWHREPAQNRGQGQGGALTAPEGRPDFQKTRRTTNRQETGYRDDNLGDGPAQFSVGQGYDSTLMNNGQTRNTNNRVNPDRAANPGRMNVRQDAIGMVGANTTTRLEASSLPIRPADGSHGQRYVVPQYQRDNIFKPNGEAKIDFNLAKDIRAKNPLAQPAFVDYAKA